MATRIGAGWMVIGSDIDSDGFPNDSTSERFAMLSFYKDGGGTSGTMNLVTRQRGDSWTGFTTIATNLSMDTWYTVPSRHRRGRPDVHRLRQQRRQRHLQQLRFLSHGRIVSVICSDAGRYRNVLRGQRSGTRDCRWLSQARISRTACRPLSRPTGTAGRRGSTLLAAATAPAASSEASLWTCWIRSRVSKSFTAGARRASRSTAASSTPTAFSFAFPTPR